MESFLFWLPVTIVMEMHHTLCLLFQRNTSLFDFCAKHLWYILNVSKNTDFNLHVRNRDWDCVLGFKPRYNKQIIAINVDSNIRNILVLFSVFFLRNLSMNLSNIFDLLLCCLRYRILLYFILSIPSQTFL